MSMEYLYENTDRRTKVHGGKGILVPFNSQQISPRILAETELGPSLHSLQYTKFLNVKFRALFSEFFF
jgi:hypothetical protein